jgi:hypothetical protein
MFESSLIETAIGVALVFFITASITAALNEWLTRIFNIRAKILWKALAHLLNPDTGQPFRIRTRDALTGFIFSDDRPSIDPIGAPSTDPQSAIHRIANTSVIKSLGGSNTLTRTKRTRVPHISRKALEASLLEASTGRREELRKSITSHLDEYRRIHQAAIRPGADAIDISQRWRLVSDPDQLAGLIWEYRGNPAVVANLGEAANNWRIAAQAQHRSEGSEYSNLLEHAQLSLPDPEGLDYPTDVETTIHTEDQVRALAQGSILASTIDAYATDSTSPQSTFESMGDLFDSSMERLTDLYRNSAQQVLFALGLVIAIAGNLNAIDLVGDLTASSDARAALVAQGRTACAEDATTCFSNTSGIVSLPVVGTYDSPLEALGITERDEVPGIPTDNDPVWQVILGWIITAFAVSFGSPFWFDLLRRLSAPTGRAFTA